MESRLIDVPVETSILTAPVRGTQRSFFSRCTLDRIGMWVSTTCAVHCAALPLLLTVSGLGWLGSELLEWGIIAFSFVVASLRLSYSYLKQHRRFDSVLLFLIGASSILLAKSETLEFLYAEAVFMTIGGLVIAVAHWHNHRLAHQAGMAHTHRH